MSYSNKEKVISDANILWKDDILDHIIGVIEGSNDADITSRLDIITSSSPGWFPSDTTGEDITHLNDLIETKIQIGSVKRVTCEVPRGIVDDHLKVILEDIKVFAPGESDDKLYNEDQELKLYFPRGLTIMKLQDIHGHSSLDAVIYANKKFTGSPIDEDNDDIINHNWRDFFIKPYEDSVKVLCMEKINGEAGHFSGRFIENKFYLFAGSKNVHLMFNEKKHIDLYEGNRFQIAKEVAYEVFSHWSNMSSKTRNHLAHFLHKTKGTITCEILRKSNQHVVVIEKDELVAYCVTPPPMIIKSMKDPMHLLTITSPLHLLQLFECLNFKIPKYEEITMDEVEERDTMVRNQTQLEGEVYYFIDKYDNTIGLLKVKTEWYLLCRAIRQKTFWNMYGRHECHDPDKIKASIEKRIKEFLDWLPIKEDDLENWIDLGKKWVDWFQSEKEKYPTRDDFSAKFPIIWDEFMKSNAL